MGVAAADRVQREAPPEGPFAERAATTKLVPETFTRHRPLTRCVDDRALDRFLSMETANLHRSLVTEQRTLADLVREEHPRLPTRDGGWHAFDRAALARLHDALSPLVRHELRLPMRVYLAHEDPGNAFVMDRTAITALTQLGEAKTQPREGKLWMGAPLAQEFARRYPTCVEFVIS